MYEKHREHLLPRVAFLKRLAHHSAVAVGIVAGSLAIGIIGFRVTEGLSWADGLLNASMLLGGMGPIAIPSTFAGKIFASAYALYAGLVFLIVAGVLFAPLFHRFLHHFHLELEQDESR